MFPFNSVLPPLDLNIYEIPMNRKYAISFGKTSLSQKGLDVTHLFSNPDDSVELLSLQTIPAKMLWKKILFTFYLFFILIFPTQKYIKENQSFFKENINK